MSKLPPSADSKQESSSKGPNLLLLYGLLILAILGAMCVAAMIVWPFYKAR